jgi:hypothetical protein
MVNRVGQRQVSIPGWILILAAASAVLLAPSISWAAPSKATQKGSHDEGSILDWPDLNPPAIERIAADSETPSKVLEYPVSSDRPSC